MIIFVRRLATAIPTLILLSLFVFVLLELTPGDAADVLLDQTASAEAQEHLRAELGLDRPLLERFSLYLWNVLHGDLGQSARTGTPVSREIATRLPYTLALVAAAQLGAIAVGGALGVLSALHHNRPLDRAITALSSLGMALPIFWVALLLVNLFAMQLRWLPVFGAESARHLILPAASTALALIPGITRLTRASLLETLGQDFILVARGKGLSSLALLRRHVTPVAAIPVVTYIGVQTVRLISSVVIIETIFNWPGLGGLAVRAAFDRDPMLLQGTTLVIAALAFFILFCVDLLVLYLDPRISACQT